MHKEINIDDLSEFDMAQYIKSDADIVEYLSQVLEEGDSGELAAALSARPCTRLCGPIVILGSTQYNEYVKRLV